MYIIHQGSFILIQLYYILCVLPLALLLQVFLIKPSATLTSTSQTAT